MKLYSWDTVMLEVVEHEVDDSIANLAPKLAMQAAEAMTADGEFSSHSHIFSVEDGVWVLKGKFGRDQDFMAYACPDDPSKAEEKAEDDLEKWAEEAEKG